MLGVVGAGAGRDGEERKGGKMDGERDEGEREKIRGGERERAGGGLHPLLKGLKDMKSFWESYYI